jgi:hypothetical protein
MNDRAFDLKTFSLLSYLEQQKTPKVKMPI